MLILDKQKAVARVVALTAGVTGAPLEPLATTSHARTYQRIATYERRVRVPPALPHVVERRRRRARLSVEGVPS